MIPYAVTYRQGTNTCTILYDLHVDIKGAEFSKKQCANLIAILAKRPVPIIVEDMFAYEGNDAAMKEQLPIIEAALDIGSVMFPGTNLINYTPLCGLCKQCTTYNIPIINTEFRFDYMLNVRYAARGMNIESTLAFEKLVQAFKTVAAEIHQYNDTVLLNTYYTTTLQTITPLLELLTAQARKELGPQEKTIFLKAFWDCMVHILDARIIHTWYQQAQQHDHVVVYVGGEHATAVENLIVGMGYSKIAQQGDRSIIEYSKKYRNAANQLQLKPVVGLAGVLTVAQNMITLWKASRLNSQCAQKYNAALKKAATLNLESLLTGN